jgi:hypothetical protein
VSVESPASNPALPGGRGSPEPRGLSGWLARAPLVLLVAYSAAAAFATYFCMYAFRKPFDATKFNARAEDGAELKVPVLDADGRPVVVWEAGADEPVPKVKSVPVKFAGSPIDLKTMCVIAQVIGYMLSKYIGTRVCSEVRARYRGFLLVGLILWAGAALALFGVLPADLKPLAMFLNGLPLGMVWGLCVRYLEGRRTTELMIAGLSCSYIIAGAATRDVGRDVVMSRSGLGVSEEFMPLVTGLLFLLPFVGGVLLLNQIPPPSAADVAARGERVEMDRHRRRAFVRHYGIGFGLLLAAYFFLTAFRDFRDHYQVEILDALGLGAEKAILSSTEKWAFLVVILTLGGMYLIRHNRAALMAVYAVITGGFAVIGVGTALHMTGALNGYWWMVACGVGLYLAYVPYGAVLFERMMAAPRFVGTAAFAIQLADGVGYTGSVLLQLLRDLVFGQFDRLQFTLPFGLVVSVAGVLLMTASGLLCVRRAKPAEPAGVV